MQTRCCCRNLSLVKSSSPIPSSLIQSTFKCSQSCAVGKQRVVGIWIEVGRILGLKDITGDLLLPSQHSQDLQISGLYRDSIGVQRQQIAVVEKIHHVGLSGLVEALHRLLSYSAIRLELLQQLPNQTEKEREMF